MFRLIKSIAEALGLSDKDNNFKKGTDKDYDGHEKYYNGYEADNKVEFNKDYVEYLRESDMTTNDSDK